MLYIVILNLLAIWDDTSRIHDMGVCCDKWYFFFRGCLS